jgi:hypothetical protein
MASDTEPQLAIGWHGYVCDGCDHYHIELLDEGGVCFALMSIAPVDLMRLAKVLVMLALDVSEPDNTVQSEAIH